MLIRSWNLYHGCTHPTGRRSYLQEIVDLAVADRPDVVLLQEVPAWALPYLGPWTGMHAVADVAQPPRAGPVPIPTEARSSADGARAGAPPVGLRGAGERDPPRRRPATRRARPPRAQPAGLPARAGAPARARPRRPPRVGEGAADLPSRPRRAGGRGAARRREPARDELAGRCARAGCRARARGCVGGRLRPRWGDGRPGRRLQRRRGRRPPRRVLEPGAGHRPPRRPGCGPGALRVWPDERRLRNGMLLSDHAPIELEIP